MKMGNYSFITQELAIGVGISAAHEFIMYGSILWESRGPGSYYTSSCLNLPLFLSSGITAMFISLMDICWLIIAFEGYRSRSFVKIGFVFFAHLASSSIVIIFIFPFFLRDSNLFLYILK